MTTAWEEHMRGRDGEQRHMPRDVARRIIERSASNQVAVVIPRNGKPARVYALDKYLKMKEQPSKHKPWSYRKPRPSLTEPLGSIDGRVLRPLGRGEIYE